MTFRFLHMADVHFDTPFQSRDEGLRKFLKESMRAAFKAGVDLAIAKEAHCFLIAGDLFDNDTLSFSTGKFLHQQLERLNTEGIRVLYSPGNHDPSGNLHKLGGMKWPSNVHIFNKNMPDTVTISDKRGTVVGVVHGAGHEAKKEGRNIVKGFNSYVEGVPNVGLVHAFVSGAKDAEGHDRYAPCSIDDLRQAGYEYWALGHIHKRAELIDMPKTVYPGNIMGRNPGETGSKGAYFVEIDETYGVKADFHNLSPVIWDIVYINDISDINDLNSLENKLYSSALEYIEKQSYSGRMLLRLVLSGKSPLHRELRDRDTIFELCDSLKASLNAVLIELITDDITRPLEFNNLRNGLHVLGTALSITEGLKEDDELLLRLKPGSLAGLTGSRRDEILKYLKSLLDNLDGELIERLTGGDTSEI